QSYGNAMGGYFGDADGSGYANVGYGHYGIRGYGNFAGGYFKDLDGLGYAYVGYGDTGVDAQGTTGVAGRGTTMGGFFEDTNGSGYANVAEDNYGIRGWGNIAGGYFGDTNSSGYAYVGYGGTGVEAHGFIGISGHGSNKGGYFEDTNESGYSDVGVGNYGIRSFGNTAGGFFEDLDTSGKAWVGYGSYGIKASGATTGGYFEDIDSSGYAYVGYGNYGIDARGSMAGGFFGDTNSSGSANVGYGDTGINARGATAGGSFTDTNSSGYAFVGYGSYKIQGNGTMAFVQNHPYDRESVIVYASPEGDEVATYTRGTARLVEGEVRVPLGETFRWVTNPDLGLTAHVTPKEDCNGVYVAMVSTEEIVVRELQRGTSNCAFDYIVYGLRIGFEESSIVQEKEREAYIPSMTDHRQLYERRPELKSFSSLERFKAMRRAAGQKDEVDLSRAHALRDAIIEFDPEVHELPGMPERPDDAEREVPALTVDDDLPGAAAGPAVRDRDVGGRAPGPRVAGPAVPMDAEGNVYATSFRPSSQDLASLLEVSEAVEPGDVMVIDRGAGSGMMRRADEASDTGVVGVVAASPGVVLGMASPTKLAAERPVDAATGEAEDLGVAAGVSALRAPVAFSGVVRCKVDADFGAIWPGDLLVTSPTPGHAMRNEAPLPGTVLGKALEALEEGTGTIRVLVMLR
ncbi:MAG: hypothetical protein ACC742_12545, partial [Thermoanaerobaculales bacterium]